MLFMKKLAIYAVVLCGKLGWIKSGLLPCIFTKSQYFYFSSSLHSDAFSFPPPLPFLFLPYCTGESFYVETSGFISINYY
jgi:hypothetical protein